MKIKLTKRAERRIEIVDHYWRTHRLEAPDLLKQELSSVGCSARSRSKVLASGTGPTLLFRRRLGFVDRLLQEFVARFEDPSQALPVKRVGRSSGIAPAAEVFARVEAKLKQR